MTDLQPIDGTATLSPDDPVVAGSAGTWTLTYTVGEDQILPGGVVRLTIPSGFTPPQADHPGIPGFVTASCTVSRATLALVEEEEEDRIRGVDVKLFLDTAPFHRREKIVIVYGDRSGGSQGAFACRVAGETKFQVAVQTGRGEMAFRPLKQSPVLRIVPAETRRVAVLIPSLVEVEKPFPVYILTHDGFGNVLPASGDRFELKTERGDLRLPSALGLKGQDHALRAAAKAAGGPFRIRAIDREDGIEGFSNPLLASERPDEVLLWGDLHGHTTCSDGSVPPDAYYAHARDVAHLDFTATTDHLQPGFNEGMGWEEVCSAASAFNEAGRFIPLVGFEDRDTSGGHCNVYCQDLAPPENFTQRRTASSPGGVDGDTLVSPPRPRTNRLEFAGPARSPPRGDLLLLGQRRAVGRDLLQHPPLPAPGQYDSGRAGLRPASRPCGWQRYPHRFPRQRPPGEDAIPAQGRTHRCLHRRLHPAGPLGWAEGPPVLCHHRGADHPQV